MGRAPGPLRLSSLVALEFRQSVRLRIRLHRLDRAKGVPQREGEKMLREFQSDMSTGTFSVVPVDWANVHRLAESLSARHSVEAGHRLADILHVATALQLGAEEFLTFDSNQKKLAEAEGLVVPF